MFTGTFLWTTV